MITIEKLTKRYGDFTAVDEVSFTCRPGQVTGFLGPNGAGKSTTMRMLVGLTPITGGRATIGGHRYTDIPNPGRHVGVLLDASAQHAGRTGREVLTLGAMTMGLHRGRVEEMLEQVSLTPTEAKRRVGDYSLGMRQRLGIAHALLGDPSVLILDEPANGLDPAGIHWMRGLLRGYAERGGTVLLSSHLLNEVELIADDIVLIGHGRIVAHDSKEALLRGSRAGTKVSATDNTRLGAVLAGAMMTHRPVDGGFVVDAEPVQVATLAASHGLVVTGLAPAGGGLEELFLTLTSDTQREAGTLPDSDSLEGFSA